MRLTCFAVLFPQKKMMKQKILKQSKPHHEDLLWEYMYFSNGWSLLSSLPAGRCSSQSSAVRSAGFLCSQYLPSPGLPLGEFKSFPVAFNSWMFRVRPTISLSALHMPKCLPGGMTILISFQMTHYPPYKRMPFPDCARWNNVCSCDSGRCSTPRSDWRRGHTWYVSLID